MSGPPDKFVGYIDTSLDSSPTAVISALNTAWSNYYTTYGVYPSVWLTVGSVIYYGGY